MRVFEPAQRIEFFCKRLVGNSDIIGDPSSMQWIPRIMELGIFFLKDDNKTVRHEVGQTMITIISVLSAAIDKTPFISRKREQESLPGKLKLAYKGLVRNESHFPRMGPRTGSNTSPNNTSPVSESRMSFLERFSPLKSNTPAQIAVDSNGWDNWDE
jgi:hypothetical protein